MPMNISLTPHPEEMIRGKISSDPYDFASEVVCEALRLLEQADQFRALKMQKLRGNIQEGLDSWPSIAFDPEEIKRTAREKNLGNARNKCLDSALAMGQCGLD